MTVTRELDPTVRQKGCLARAAGTARHAFNWGLHPCERLLKAGKPVPRPAGPHRVWDAGKPRRSWVRGVSKCCGQEAPRDLDRASWRGREEARRIGSPRFRKKHGRRDSFRLTGSIHAHPRSVSLPRIGCVRTREAIRGAIKETIKETVKETVKEATTKFRGRVLSETVGREADRWCASLAVGVEVERDDPPSVNGPAVGIDLGLKSFAVPSDGARLASPRPLGKAPRRLCHRQRLHNREHLGSRNRRKSAAGLARPHRRSRCQRTDFLRKTTTELAKTKGLSGSKTSPCAA